MAMEQKTDAMQGQPPSPQASLAAMQDVVRRNSSVFWVNQEKMLDTMQDFASGWFERRHKGASAALECSRRLARVQNPAEAFAEYQAWAKGAMERTMADALAVQKQLLNVAEAAKRPEPH